MKLNGSSSTLLTGFNVHLHQFVLNVLLVVATVQSNLTRPPYTVLVAKRTLEYELECLFYFIAKVEIISV